MSTLDPNIEIPADAPLAVGHTPEQAKAHKEAADAYRDQVESEKGQPDVGAREPGDHAEAKKPKKKDE